jgi:hypothetical protein
MNKFFYILIFVLSLCGSSLNAQEHSVAREWNEVLLEAIRGDFARPTVHARNLFHTSIALYDAWAVYDSGAKPYFLGNTLGGYEVPFDGVLYTGDDIKAAQEEAMSYAAYRILSHRFAESPQAFISQQRFNLLMSQLGYDINNTSTNYQDGEPAHLGNYIAEQMIQFGMQDGSNEANEYVNQYYLPINPDLEMDAPGNPNIIDPNRWQPLSLTTFIDQSGNPLIETPEFLSPEWGNVTPFALADSVQNTYSRDDNDYNVFHDPGAPPFLDTSMPSDIEDAYKWGFALVVTWSAHCDPADGVMWDISPASIGKNPAFPDNFDDYPQFYDLFNGGDIGEGHDINPHTGQPYEPQMVPRGDYARVLAEFWADGPDSETPPGHWYTILNYVNDNPLLEKRWQGEGEILDDLEWDVKAYLVLGGAMHDSAISAWSVKGWYDYIRPVSAIRYMAGLGQSTSQNLPSYHPNGIPYLPGFIEVVEEDDPLAGDNGEHIGKIKFRAWRGPDYIENPISDVAGVDWILGENWWPYQRPTFVTPPFAGYVSGHSTYSRAAAEVLTLMTGDPFFPGGMGEFEAPQNQFLVFEDGPSVDLTLQWATYRDASDQCSLSRIWGGIHPPADDIPGRLMGEKIGVNAFNFAQSFIIDRSPRVTQLVANESIVNSNDAGENFELSITYSQPMDLNTEPTISFIEDNPTTNTLTQNAASWLNDTTFVLTFDIADAEETLRDIQILIENAADLEGNNQIPFLGQDVFEVDTENPMVSASDFSTSLIADSNAGDQLSIQISFSEAMDTDAQPDFQLNSPSDLSNSILPDELNSGWLDENTYLVTYFTFDADEEIASIDVLITDALDAAGNTLVNFELANVLTIDTEQPSIGTLAINETVFNESNVGETAIVMEIDFSEEMNTDLTPELNFPNQVTIFNSISLNTDASEWLSANQYRAVYELIDIDAELDAINVLTTNAADLAGNNIAMDIEIDIFSIDTKKPSTEDVVISEAVLSDSEVGTSSVFINLIFDENMDITQVPSLSFPIEDPSSSLTQNEASSQWLTPSTYRARFDLADENIELEDIDLSFGSVTDEAGNTFIAFTAHDLFSIDTRNPELIIFSANTYDITNENIGEDGFNLLAILDEDLNTDITPNFDFPVEMPVGLSLNADNSYWINNTTYLASYDVANEIELLADIDVEISNLEDLAGNPAENVYFEDYFSINIPVGTNEIPEEFQNILVFPNPTNVGNDLNIHFQEIPQDVQIRMYDVTGKLIQSLENVNDSKVEWPTKDLNSGIYFLHFISPNGQMAVKVNLIRS